MTGPAPAVAAVRQAVRESLSDLPAGTPVAVALSGGQDSLALLAATAFLRPGDVLALVVDHGWQAGSDRVAREAAARAGLLGATARVLAAPSPRDEAAARDARYRVLGEAARAAGAPAVLLGHTRDDQAETVLLGLLRGSGARSLAGMAPRRDPYRRPLLDLPRAVTADACAAQGLRPHADPANLDLRFRRSRMRHQLLPTLTEVLERDVAANLARTARLLRDDADLLDRLADEAAADLAHPEGLPVSGLERLPAALRRRVLHRLAPRLGAVHVQAIEALVVSWHGQGAVALPGGARAVREHGRIRVMAPDPGESA